MESSLVYQEDLLHYLWRRHKIPKMGLKTTQGEDIEILGIGVYNESDGPDFLQAKVRIGQEIWVGPVEIHTKSSDWYAHNHHNDRRYDSVILHVVAKENKAVFMGNRLLPCLEINKFITLAELQNYKRLKDNHAEIPCLRFINGSMQEEFSWMRDSLLTQRFQRRLNELVHPGIDAPSLFYTLILGSLGAKRNKVSFQEFGKLVPWIQLKRWANNESRILEYLMYLSGLFPEHPYLKSNLVVFEALAKKPIKENSWLLKGTRPPNHPKKRLLDFFEWIRDGKFNRLIEAENAFVYGDSWNDAIHELRISCPKPSEFTLKNMALNAIAPFAFYRGVQSGDTSWFDFAIGHVNEWSSENNNVIKAFNPLQIDLENAGDSQALLELFSTTCKKKKCLTCAIGINLMSA